MNICFFCRIKNPTEAFQRAGFYAVDLQILRELGHRVTISTTPWRIPRADLYVVWWWTWAFFPLLRAKLIHKPVVVLGVFDHILETGNLEVYPNRPWLHRQMMKWVLKHADANVVTSRDQETYLRANFRVNNLQYGPLVIDTDLYRPGTMPREKFFATFCWMNNGNSRRKCIPEAIRTMALLHRSHPDYRLLVCGKQGSDYPALKALVRELDAKDYIEFKGAVSKEEKVDLMQRCAVYLQPTRAEGFGMAILEAMACGAAVVTSPVGSVPGVGGNTVEMVDGTDPDAISRAVEGLLRDDNKRAELGQAARERAVKQFSFERRKNDLDRIINRVAAARAGKAA